MNSKLILIACLALAVTLTACSKQDNAPAAEQSATSELVVADTAAVSAEQQAAIDAVDKPLQDENNTDIPDSVANASADQATPDENTSASTAQ